MPPISPPPLIEVRRFARLVDARESSLALAAKDLAYVIERDGDTWTLQVEESALGIAELELSSFEAEQLQRPVPEPAADDGKIPTLSLYVAGWILSAFFLAQQLGGPEWTGRGAAGSRAIVEQWEWWRALTALTLHGDLGHLVANLGAGLLFVAFLLPQLGTGLAWLLVVLAGATGNAVNAWGYRGEEHLSIGASTGVFGALGLLVGIEFFARWAHPAPRKRWQIVLPVGAGFALLAYLGVGEAHERVDFMAHWWGFVCGSVLGGAAAVLRGKERIGARMQRWFALAATLLIAAAWMLALRS